MDRLDVGHADVEEAARSGCVSRVTVGLSAVGVVVERWISGPRGICIGNAATVFAEIDPEARKT
jgi:hypothetical protein